MFPAAPVFYNQPVKPGDAMSASVTANGGGAFTLTLSDQTENWTQTTQQTSQTAQLGSAEVIAEAPSSQNGVLPLSNFGTVNFTNALADNAPIGNAGADSLTMVAANGTTEATPSALTDGDAFAVTFGGGGATTGGGSPAPTGSTAPSGSTPPHHRGQPGPQPHGARGTAITTTGPGSRLTADHGQGRQGAVAGGGRPLFLSGHRDGRQRVRLRHQGQQHGGVGPGQRGHRARPAVRVDLFG